MDQCPICINKFSKQSRRKIRCPDPECQFQCCINCIKEFIIISKNDAKCMKCNKLYSRYFLQEQMPTNWLTNIFKKSRQTILFEREKSLFSATMPYVNSEIEARKHETECIKLNAEISELKNKINSMNLEIDLRKETIYQLRTGELLESTEEFKTKCPNCEGFIGKNMICSLCDTKICKYCTEIIDKDEIVIKPEQTIESTEQTT